MTSTITVEWVEFQLRADVTESELLAVSQGFQVEFLSLQPGYIKRTLLRLNESGRYADLVHWSDAAAMRAAMASSPAFPVCGAYFALIEAPEAPSLGVPVAHYEGDADAPVSSVGGLEFSFFLPKDGVTDAMLKSAAKKVADGLYRGQPGYFRHSVMKTEQGMYADVVFASSAKRAAELCGMWGTGPYAEPCLPYLEMIRPETMQIAFFENLR